MAVKKTGLGRGLGALIPQGGGKTAVIEKEKGQDGATHLRQGFGGQGRGKTGQEGAELVAAASVREILLSEMVVNPEQPRVNFGHRELEELTDSIREHGILQPLAVTEVDGGRYEIIAGERRFRAAKMAGLKSVPVIVRQAEASEKLVLALIENIQREDLNPIEEARAYGRLTREFGLTQEGISKKVGKARSTVANIMRLLELPEEIRKAVESGTVSAGSARALIGIADDRERTRMFRKLAAGKMTTRDAEAGARQATGNSKRDPSVAAVEEDLRGKYGTKVVVTKRQGRGKISMSFYSEEEYAELAKKLLG